MLGVKFITISFIDMHHGQSIDSLWATVPYFVSAHGKH